MKMIAIISLMLASSAIGFLVGSTTKQPASDSSGNRYEMHVDGTRVIRLDRKNGTLHYSTSTWAGDVPEDWMATPTPPPKAPSSE